MKYIPLLVVLPLGAAFFTALLGQKRPRLCSVIANATLLALTLLAIHLFIVQRNLNTIIYRVGGWNPPIGIPLIIDPLTILMLLLVTSIAFLVTLFSVTYMETFTAAYKFYTLLLLMIGGMNGVLLSGDLFNIFVFFELGSITSYALVAYNIEDRDFEAAFKYMVMGVVGSLFMLLGIGFLYAYASTLNLADLSLIMHSQGMTKTVLFSALLIFVGLAIKSGVIPFHAWVPDAYTRAPAPVAALLSGLLGKSLGLYVICRLFFTVFPTPQVALTVCLLAGGASIVVGGLLALGQTDLKRMLAYSSISQIGYIVLALGIATPLAIMGALLHMLNHACAKSLLFLNAGAIEHATGMRTIQDLSGLREKMPVTAATSLVASLSISGIPPFGGFFSKLLIVLACIKSGHAGYGLLAITGSILTIAYCTKFQKYLLFGNLHTACKHAREVPLLMKSAMTILAVMCILSGALLLPKYRTNLLSPAQEILVKKNEFKTMAYGIIHEK